MRSERLRIKRWVEFIVILLAAPLWGAITTVSSASVTKGARQMLHSFFACGSAEDDGLFRLIVRQSRTIKRI